MLSRAHNFFVCFKKRPELSAWMENKGLEMSIGVAVSGFVSVVSGAIDTVVNVWNVSADCLRIIYRTYTPKLTILHPNQSQYFYKLLLQKSRQSCRFFHTQNLSSICWLTEKLWPKSWLFCLNIRSNGQIELEFWVWKNLQDCWLFC